MHTYRCGSLMEMRCSSDTLRTIVFCHNFTHMQWNLSIEDTTETLLDVLYREVSLIQR